MIGPTSVQSMREQAPILFAQVYPKGTPTLDEMMQHLVEGFDEVEKFHDLSAWSLLAEDALDIMFRLRIPFERGEFVALVCHKQHDYGHENILKFGIDGVIVRTWDKIARLQNLLRRGFVAANEPIADTLTDIVGYCVIGIMLNQGWFTLPLEADLEGATA